MRRLGRIFYERPSGLKQQTSFGVICFDDASRECTVGLQAWRQGHVCCLPQNPDTAPFLRGDLMFETQVDDMARKQFLKCGFLWTESDQRGPAYQVILELDPTPSLLLRELRRMQRPDYSPPTLMWLNCWLDDKDQRQDATQDGAGVAAGASRGVG